MGSVHVGAVAVLEVHVLAGNLVAAALGRRKKTVGARVRSTARPGRVVEERDQGQGGSACLAALTLDEGFMFWQAIS